MARTIKCPQCGGTDPKRISETEFECIYCSTNIYIDPPKSNRPNKQENNVAAVLEHSRKTGRAMVFIIISVLLVILSFIFYMTQQSLTDYKDTMEDVRQQFSPAENQAGE